MLWAEFKKNHHELYTGYWIESIPKEYIKLEAKKMMEQDTSHSSYFDDPEAMDLNLKILENNTTSNLINTYKLLKSQEFAHKKEIEQYEEKDKTQVKTLKEDIEQYENKIETEKAKYERKVDELNESESKYQDKWKEVENLNTKLEDSTKNIQNLVDEMYSMINTFASIGNRFQLNNHSLLTILTKLNIEK